MHKLLFVLQLLTDASAFHAITMVNVPAFLVGTAATACQNSMETAVR